MRVSWPLWYGYEDNGQMFRGQMIDLSQNAVSITVNNQPIPSPGDHIFTRFSYPLEHSDEFAMDNYLHWSEVIRVTPTRTGSTRIALRLHEPLRHDPSRPTQEASALAV